MSSRLALLGLCFCLPLAVGATEPAKEAWLVKTDLWGNTSYQTLTFAQEGQTLTGVFDGDKLVGTRRGNALDVTVIDASNAIHHLTATITGAAMTGVADDPDTNSPGKRASHPFTGHRLPQRPDGPPKVYSFTPRYYSNEFSATRAPVLTVWPGDGIRTQTIDSGGVDRYGNTVALFGNPQVGPFYVVGAEPGDTLAVHIRQLRLNRDYADSLDSIVGPALGRSVAAEAQALGKPVRWKLDREKGLASPLNPTPALSHYSVPVRPMLGGMAVAPGFGSPAMSTGDTGRSGGNMDFNQVVEGNTVYLPVYQPGALLYFGDAHALQGDGETSQYALETSMDVEVSVDVIHGKTVSMPRVESPTQLMVLGQAGSVDEATRAATTGLIKWLAQDYGLTLSEAAQVLGSSVHYSVANLAGRSVGVAASLDKALLANLQKPAGK
ncbi:acetamidase/formamidase family protein [Xanthomonas sp. NCPPB 2632]|uniref:acetamidase/formamidase family protein n=1 Tax=Xanthomonas sp. NCPPB 2632 TaxID=3240912 RepID=UPI003515AD29